MNEVVLIGRLSKDPELKFVPSTGMAITKFTLAVDKDIFGDKKQEAIKQGKPTADFINITVFGKSAESCANHLAKGSQCAVHGRLTTGSYTAQSGEKKYTTEVTTDKVEFIGAKKEDKFTPTDDNIFDDDDFFK